MSQLNHIQKVAIIGASGRIGSYFVSSLLSTGKHSITAISRHDSTSTFDSNIAVTRADYSSQDSLVPALRGHDFLIITLSVQAPPDLHSRIVKAAISAGIPYIMPNVYGCDIENENLRNDDMFTANAYKMCKEIEELGGKHIVMACGFWYEWSLALGEQWFGFDIKDRKVTFFDDGETKISTSTWLHCGDVLAALLSLPVKKGDGEGAAIENWKNKPVFISSFYVSQRDMLDSIHRILGTTDADWQIKKEPTAQRVKDGAEELQKGDRRGFAKSLYSRVFYPNGDGDFEDRKVDDMLGLKKEELDEATKRAVDMVNSGWTPF